VINSNPVLPGVREMILNGRARGLKIAAASSSHHAWVDTHLARLGLIQHYDKIFCADDVAPGRTKPNPDLFLLALDQLQVQKEEAVIFEDSPNGVKAAQAAGIFVVAVPNPLTKKMGVRGDLTVNSLADLPLDELLKKFDGS
jgi:HAD superfamily hydrolase (TIGR01509 family)